MASSARPGIGPSVPGTAIPFPPLRVPEGSVCISLVGLLVRLER